MRIVALEEHIATRAANGGAEEPQPRRKSATDFDSDIHRAVMRRHYRPIEEDIEPRVRKRRQAQ